MSRVDVLVIGGGIHGAAIARDAAGRGLSVVLAERDDYAAAASSNTSKLIHGGLRYLENSEMRLVRESLRERAILLNAAPHLVRPLRFLLPVRDGGRPPWKVRAGLWLYDRLAGSGPPPSGAIDGDDLDALPWLRRDGLRRLLHYTDCQGDDSRLVIENLLDARARGADIANRRSVVGLRRVKKGFQADIQQGENQSTLTARFVINTAGPWAGGLLDMIRDRDKAFIVSLVRGSHIVVPVPEDAPGMARDAWTLMLDDRRVVFVVPWEGRLLIGTTEVIQSGDPARPHCSPEERDYLLAAVNGFFRWPGAPLTPDDIVWTFAGVRALADSGVMPRTMSRDYAMEVASNADGAIITVHGGKLTTHRKLAEKILALMGSIGAPVTRPWTATTPFPGGGVTLDELDAMAENGPSQLSQGVRRRWCRTYGARAQALFDAVSDSPALAREVANGVPEAELLHARDVEDARNADDFLLRRTKLVLELTADERDAVAAWFRAGESDPAGGGAQVG